MKFENIRNLREDNDKTQKEVAAYLNIKQTTYSKYELGKQHQAESNLTHSFLVLATLPPPSCLFCCFIFLYDHIQSFLG